jgi:hypothetical protein
VLLCQETHFVGFILSGGEWFFDQYIDAGLHQPSCNIEVQNCGDGYRRSLDFAVRGEHLLDRTKRFAVKLAGGFVGARGIGIDHAYQANMAGEFELAIDAGMIASKGADADYCDIDR